MKINNPNPSSLMTRTVGLIDRWIWIKPLPGSFETSQKRVIKNTETSRYYE